MSEMQLTADRLVILGKGRLIADESMDRLMAGTGVRVRGPQLQPLADALPTAAWTGSEELTIAGTSLEEIGGRAHALGLMLHELRPLDVSLEEIYMQLTADSTEFGAQA